MKFTLDSCPYCRAKLTDIESGAPVCTVCGKGLCADRTAIFSFNTDVHIEGMLSLQNLIDDELYDEALKRVDQVIENSHSGESEEKRKKDADAFLLRGLIWSFKGEDGRALNDWNKAITAIGDCKNFDWYLCVICKAIAKMMYEKEFDYIEFEFIRYINRISDLFSEVTGSSLRAFTFYTVYVNYVRICKEKEAEGETPIIYIIPQLFRNVVVYYKNYPNLRNVVEDYLKFINYNESTYEEDRMEQCHLYDVVSKSIEHHCSVVNPERIEEAKNHWDDKSMEELDDLFSEMEKWIRSKKKQGSLEELVHNYAHKCLLLGDCKTE